MADAFTQIYVHLIFWPKHRVALIAARRSTLCRYVLNQKKHHRKKTFKAEFLKLCEDFGVEPGRKEYFDWLKA